MKGHLIKDDFTFIFENGILGHGSGPNFVKKMLDPDPDRHKMTADPQSDFYRQIYFFKETRR
jgi:hypothetical protein